jgi:uncharacterized membrane protein
MTLTPEERRKIYEEEKARIEAEKTPPQPAQTSTTELKPNTAGLLCYLGFWITGIIFIVLEQKNRTIRFHAIQSIIVFGSLNIVYLLLRPIPFVGLFFGVVIGVLAFVLWLLLMIKGSQGYFSLPVAGDLAEKILGSPPSATPPSTPPPTASGSSSAPSPPPPAPPPPATPQQMARNQQRYDRGRSGRIVSSIFAIAFSIALLVFLNFYNKYIAYYHLETVSGASVWTHEPFLTSSFSTWLPVVNTALVFNIIGHAILVAVDKYILREGTLIVLDFFSIVSTTTLLIIFPFDFSVIGGSVATAVDISVRVTLVIIIFGVGIAVLVRLIKILVNGIRGTATY